MCFVLRVPANYRTIARSTRDGWSQAQCLMTKQHAAHAMSALVEGAIRPDALNAPSAVVPTGARTVVSIGVRTVVHEAVLNARGSAVVRCLLPRSQGCPSRRSPKA